LISVYLIFEVKDVISDKANYRLVISPDSVLVPLEVDDVSDLLLHDRFDLLYVFVQLLDILTVHLRLLVKTTPDR
jgi:hypothetical protein